MRRAASWRSAGLMALARPQSACMLSGSIASACRQEAMAYWEHYRDREIGWLVACLGCGRSGVRSGGLAQSRRWRLAVAIIGTEVLGSQYSRWAVQGGVSVTIAGALLLYVKRPSVRFVSREIELKQIVDDHRPSSCAPLSPTSRMAKNESLRVRRLQTPIVLFDPPCCEWQGFHMA